MILNDKLYLPDVTLFGCDAAHTEGMKRAADICQRQIQFGDVVIITERMFPGATREEGRRNYSEFIFKKLTNYFTTSHVLVINDDGYIQSPFAWNDEWLKFSYIGACWDWYNEHQNGNGGFSLRSKELCDILAKDETMTDTHPEDDRIGRRYRPYLEKQYGIKFAPVEVCKKFSIEGWGLRQEFNVWNGEFGYHGFGVKNLPIPPQR